MSYDDLMNYNGQHRTGDNRVHYSIAGINGTFTACGMFVRDARASNADVDCWRCLAATDEYRLPGATQLPGHVDAEVQPVQSARDERWRLVPGTRQRGFQVRP